MMTTTTTTIMPNPARAPSQLVRLWLWLWAAVALAVAGVAACSADDVGPQSRFVGGRCTTDGDCVKRCLNDGAFPGGYCTLTCASDGDCPDGATCAATAGGGVCLATCRTAAHCEGYGAGYACRLVIRQAGGDGASVCLGR